MDKSINRLFSNKENIEEYRDMIHKISNEILATIKSNSKQLDNDSMIVIMCALTLVIDSCLRKTPEDVRDYYNDMMINIITNTVKNNDKKTDHIEKLAKELGINYPNTNTTKH